MPQPPERAHNEAEQWAHVRLTRQPKNLTSSLGSAWLPALPALHSPNCGRIRCMARFLLTAMPVLIAQPSGILAVVDMEVECDSYKE